MKKLKRCAALIAAAAIFAFVFASCHHGPKTTTYTVTVTDGTANPATAAAGATIAIKANEPAEGKAFDKWTTTTEGVAFASETSAETTFEMPAKNVTIAATYKDAASGGGGSSSDGSPEEEETVSLNTPLTLEAIEAGTVTVSNAWPTLKYTLNDGDLTAYGEAITVAAGDKICFYAESSGNSSSNYGNNNMSIACSADCYVYGNIMSLVTLEAGAASASQWNPEATTLTTAYAFNRLFRYSDQSNVIKSHASKKLYLPATTLADHCYESMFVNCAALTVAPELPATTLSDFCYASMFKNCTALTTAPELPAATLMESCYSNMFTDCTSLSYIKCLATDISASACTTIWVRGVAATGTFVRVSGAGWSSGKDGIPSSWTVPGPEALYVAAKVPTENRPGSIVVAGLFGDDVAMELNAVTTYYIAYPTEDFKAYEFDTFKICSSDNNTVLCKANGSAWEPAVFVFGKEWEDDTWKGNPIKWIELDLSDADTYAWKVIN